MIVMAAQQQRGMMNVFPPLNIPTPILSLAVSAGDVWAGGVNGAARFDGQRGTWQPRSAGFPISRVAALLNGDGWLLAGGPEGIARSVDDGAHWQLAAIEGEFTPITCLAADPNKSVIFAGTLSGLLRSTDDGKTWDAITALAEIEIAALWWGKDQVLAATNEGIQRSEDGGTTWKAGEGVGGESVLTISALTDGRLIAVLDAGGLLISADGGRTWQPFTSVLPEEAEGAAIHCTAQGAVLLGTSNGQLYRSGDQGKTWNAVLDAFVFAFAETEGRLWAGATTGVLTSADDGLTWTLLPYPPTHDLDRIVTTQGRVYVAGEFSGLVCFAPEQGEWTLLPETPTPLTLLHAAPDGILYASGPDGLLKSTDSGETWQPIVRGFLGHIRHLALDNSGYGQAVTVTNRYFLRTLDGVTWKGANSPFEKLSAIGLAINAGNCIVVTYDPNTRLAQVCRSSDKGVSWECNEDFPVQIPFAATYSDPLLIGLDNSVIRIGEDGGWQMLQFGAGMTIRKFVGNANLIIGLTTGGLVKSADRGQMWQAWQPAELDQVRDIALTEADLYVLTSIGVVTIPLA